MYGTFLEEKISTKTWRPKHDVKNVFGVLKITVTWYGMVHFYLITLTPTVKNWFPRGAWKQKYNIKLIVRP